MAQEERRNRKLSGWVSVNEGQTLVGWSKVHEIGPVRR